MRFLNTNQCIRKQSNKRKIRFSCGIHTWCQAQSWTRYIRVVNFRHRLKPNDNQSLSSTQITHSIHHDDGATTRTWCRAPSWTRYPGSQSRVPAQAHRRTRRPDSGAASDRRLGSLAGSASRGPEKIGIREKERVSLDQNERDSRCFTTNLFIVDFQHGHRHAELAIRVAGRDFLHAREQLLATVIQ